MNPDLASVVAGLVGVLLGVVLALGLSRTRPGEKGPPERDTAVLLPEMVEVLAALRSSALVLDAADVVLLATREAYSMALVRNDRVTVEPLLAMARKARRDGAQRQADLAVPRGPFGSDTFQVEARVAALGNGLVLVLVEDRTESRRVDAVRRDFVANVSHELKTPVGALHLLAEAVLDASADPEAVRRFAGRMQHEAGRLSELVQELIDLSRLQYDDPLLEADLVDLDDVVVEATDRCRLAAQARGITVVTGGESDLTVLGDRTQLITAVRNLVDNAVSYSPEGTRVAVGVRGVRAPRDPAPPPDGDGGQPGEDIVEVTVTDQGLGIPEADLERVFERFYRVDPARSRATGGTGLGLSIVKHIIGNHGGEVSVWSVEGSGSTFTVRLPAPTAAGARSAHPVNRSSLPTVGSGRKAHP